MGLGDVDYKVNISQKDATVQTFTEAFSNQTGVLFSYNSSLSSYQLGKINLKEENSLEKLLDKALSAKGISFQLVGNAVVLSRKVTNKQETPVHSEVSQRRTVSGQVLDDKGQAVLGATVVEKGNLSNGVIVDLDGKFSISAPENAVLVFECIGYRTAEETIKGKDNLEIILAEDTQLLDESVVVGYQCGVRIQAQSYP